MQPGNSIYLNIVDKIKRANGFPFALFIWGALP